MFIIDLKKCSKFVEGIILNVSKLLDEFQVSSVQMRRNKKIVFISEQSSWCNV